MASRFAKIQLVVPEDVVNEIENKFGNKLTDTRLIKKVAEHSQTTSIVSRNLIGEIDLSRRRG